ncbi:MAG: NAD-dependent epimerase/dehydratase family protein [Gammaproteobacteria bacterium]|nr:NAD-dependent epimerase/dehydratase family protein [Gammaproteobacteria bacterium]
MKILIIGVNGFIGHHIKDYLTGTHDVYSADITGEASATHVLLDKNESDFTGLFHGHEFDVCVNCSGAANVSLSIETPLYDYTLNVLKVIQLLEAIRLKSPLTKFINLSSAAVYGNPESLPINEQANVNPVSPYGYHKQQAEIICQEFYQQYNIPTVSLRIFSAYGPLLSKQIFWDVYQRSKESTELSLFGTGQETRDFIYVKDIVEAIECVINRAEFIGEKINVANGAGITINEAVRTFLDLLDWKGVLKFTGEERVGDPIHWQSDISKIQSLGYRQQYSLSSGLSEVVNWLKERR